MTIAPLALAANSTYGVRLAASAYAGEIRRRTVLERGDPYVVDRSDGLL